MLEKENNDVMIIDIASIVDKRLKVKETEQVKKDFRRVKKVKVIPVVVGVLGSKSKKNKKWFGKMGLISGLDYCRKQFSWEL